MSKQEYSNQAITEYLLGSLPEAETEHFDELSFTNNEFAEALKSAEKDLVDSYVQGELAGRTLEKFKSHYLSSTARRQKVEFAKAFLLFTEQNIIETKTENSAAQRARPKQIFLKFFSALNIFANSRPVLKWSFAVAALAFMFTAGWLWFANIRLGQQPANESIVKNDARLEREQNNQNRPQIPPTVDTENGKEIAKVTEERERHEQRLKRKQAPNQQRNIERKELRVSKQPLSASPSKINTAFFILLPPVRSNNSIPNLSIPARVRYVAMRLQLESDDYLGYRVALVNPSGDKELWRSGKLETKISAESKALNVRFPAKLLKSQIYSLVVSGIKINGVDEIISNYSFRAVVK